MSTTILIPEPLYTSVYAHLFQNALEQAAFLLAQAYPAPDGPRLEAVDAYLVPPEGWELQHQLYLELKDSERANIMYRARTGSFALIDCHSHPRSTADVRFSPSDRSGITNFAAYAKWKLDGRPYVAMVWGQASVDAVAWYGDFLTAARVKEVVVTGQVNQVLRPRATWFGRWPALRRNSQHGT